MDDETTTRVGEVGELLIRAAAVLGTLNGYQLAALSSATDGKLVAGITAALEAAAVVSPQVVESLRTHPPKGFDSLAASTLRR